MGRTTLPGQRRPSLRSATQLPRRTRCEFASRSSSHLWCCWCPSKLRRRRLRTSAALVLTEGLVYLNDRPVEANSVPSVLPDAVVLRTARAARRSRSSAAAGSFWRRAHRCVYSVTACITSIESRRSQVRRLSRPKRARPSSRAKTTSGSRQVGYSASTYRTQTPETNGYCRFRVFEGAAAVPLVSVTNALRAGQTMMCNRRCGDMVQTNEFSRGQLDEFDRWARQMLARLRG